MEDKLTLRQKLQKIQLELSVPKTQRNSFGNYNYRSCEDILEALKPLLEKYGCLITIGDKIIQVGERYYVLAQVCLKDADSEAEVFTEALAREEECKKGMDGSQITGASSSYARKYALNGLFGIDDTKDSDTTNVEKKTELVREPITGKGLEVFCEVCKEKMTEKTGINKDGKKWTGYFCPNKEHKPRWV